MKKPDRYMVEHGAGIPADAWMFFFAHIANAHEELEKAASSGKELPGVEWFISNFNNASYEAESFVKTAKMNPPRCANRLTETEYRLGMHVVELVRGLLDGYDPRVALVALREVRQKIANELTGLEADLEMRRPEVQE